MSSRLSRWLLWAGGVVAAGVVLFLLIQLVPVARTNPPVLAEPPWDSDQTRALAERACFDCHSNETVWPWYASVAPVSWLVVHDTDEGRSKLNFSEWGAAQLGGREDPAEEAAREIERGNMPPPNYILLHPNGRLTDAEKQQLIDGLAASLR